MTDADRHRLRETFGEDAVRYDRYRPGYPEALLDDLTVVAGLRPGRRVLEIGPGTGQLTVPLARSGVELVGVELSPAMAAAARRNLTGSVGTAPVTATIVVSAFEDWPLPAEPFDLVVSATAFHWVDPAVRISRCAEALRPGGTLAVVSTHHVAGGTDDFFAQAQSCYRAFDPGTPPDFRMPGVDEIPFESAEFDASGRFGPVRFRRHEWDRDYDTDGYLGLLGTYSNHRALAAETRAGLFGCLRDLIEDRFGGRITKRYLTQLATAQCL